MYSTLWINVNSRCWSWCFFAFGNATVKLAIFCVIDLPITTVQQIITFNRAQTCIPASLKSVFCRQTSQIVQVFLVGGILRCAANTFDEGKGGQSKSKQRAVTSFRVRQKDDRWRNSEQQRWLTVDRRGLTLCRLCQTQFKDTSSCRDASQSEVQQFMSSLCLTVPHTPLTLSAGSKRRSSFIAKCICDCIQLRRVIQMLLHCSPMFKPVSPRQKHEPKKEVSADKISSVTV